MPRLEQLNHLESQSFDILVIGGGIVGAGVARDASMRGLKVALIERGDFAGGASSRTSKLIHGGLRYLEYGYFRLVFESLRERAILKSLTPAYIRPLSFLIPVYEGDSHPVWQIRLGLLMYDILAGKRGMTPHRMLSATQATSLEPALSKEGLNGAGGYSDAQMDDARFCLANILQAVNFGATCCNYVELKSFLRVGGTLCGGAVEDIISGRSFEIKAKVVINATGPWSDRVRRLSNPNASRRLAPTKGIHILLPRISQQALFFQGHHDGRRIFVQPWGEYSLVGTTETAVNGSLDALHASNDEVGYLLDTLHRVIPRHSFSEDDVVMSYAGARPLLAYEGSSMKATREHSLDMDSSGLLSIMGGKYTTYRVMAEQAVDYVIKQQRFTADRCLTDRVSLLEDSNPVTLNHWTHITQGIDSGLLGRLLLRYGPGTYHILRLLEQEPGLAHPVCPHHATIEAEIIYGFQREMACTITDVLARRTRIAWSGCQGRDALHTIVGLFRYYADFSRERMSAQVQDYLRFLESNLSFRKSVVLEVGGDPSLPVRSR